MEIKDILKSNCPVKYAIMKAHQYGGYSGECSGAKLVGYVPAKCYVLKKKEVYSFISRESQTTFEVAFNVMFNRYTERFELNRLDLRNRNTVDEVNEVYDDVTECIKMADHKNNELIKERSSWLRAVYENKNFIEEEENQIKNSIKKVNDMAKKYLEEDVL